MNKPLGYLDVDRLQAETTLEGAAAKCGIPLDVKGSAAELEIAQEKKKEYFLLAAYSDKTCTKPTTALSTDKIYKWTWDNLKTLIGGGR